jgi:glycosyltransferase involved in cell wall biosynthesis
MSCSEKSIQILYSFPHPLGTGRIADTAWYQVKGLADAGGEVKLLTVSNHKPLPKSVCIQTTLSRGGLRIPYRVLGRMRAFAFHDYLVARHLEKLAGKVDIVHTWPLGALETLKSAAKLGIPTVLERPNAHTQFAYEVVQKECERLGVSMPRGHEHAYNEAVLRKEEQEYELADRLLCPSDFVARTFRERGFSPEKLARHQYGFDEKTYCPSAERRGTNQGFTILFVGGCAPRKGLHYALEAWLKSPAHRDGTFLIAGQFIPGYADRLSSMLSHPSVRVLGHRSDVPELMRKSDILVLPSIEEGSALVTSEARGSGCVLLVSEAAGAICRHLEDALVHRVGDVDTLAQHLTLVYEDRALLEKLRAASLSTVHEITWKAAGLKLLNAYRDVIAGKQVLKTRENSAGPTACLARNLGAW